MHSAGRQSLLDVLLYPLFFVKTPDLINCDKNNQEYEAAKNYLQCLFGKWVGAYFDFSRFSISENFEVFISFAQVE